MNSYTLYDGEKIVSYKKPSFHFSVDEKALAKALEEMKTLKRVLLEQSLQSRHHPHRPTNPLE